MSELSLGDANRFMRIVHDAERYGPPRKMAKFRKHITSGANVAFLPNSKIIVCDKVGERVRFYGVDGAFFGTLGRNICPEGIATTGSGMVALVDIKKRHERCIRVFSSYSGDLYAKWGEDFGQWKPKGMAFSNKGQLLITHLTAYDRSVGVYTLDGKQLMKFGSGGKGPSNLKHPCYVAVDVFDRILVSDRADHMIKVFDEKGTFLGKVGGYGTGNGQLRSPRGVCSDSRGNIFVCDTDNRRICVFSLYGRFIQNLLTSDDGVSYPYGIAYNKESNLLVVTHHYSNIDDGHLRKVSVYSLNALPPLIIRKRSIDV